MNNDLISRKWLTDAIRNRRTYLSYEDAKDVIDLINNAPAVDIKDQIAGAYNEGFMCGNKEAEKARPQGEWNYIQAGMCVCPFCGAMPHKLYKNYCANCGAEMKGGAE